MYDMSCELVMNELIISYCDIEIIVFTEIDRNFLLKNHNHRGQVICTGGFAKKLLGSR